MRNAVGIDKAIQCGRDGHEHLPKRIRRPYQRVRAVATRIGAAPQMTTTRANDADHESSKAEAHLRLVIDTIPGFVWSARPDGSIEFLNQRGLDYTGLPLEQIRGWNWKDTNLHPDDRQGLFETWSAIVASGQPGEIQARLRRFDGEYRWFLFRVAPLRDESGRLVSW